jgi:hypothetical protein
LAKANRRGSIPPWLSTLLPLGPAEGTLGVGDWALGGETGAQCYPQVLTSDARWVTSLLGYWAVLRPTAQGRSE